MGRKITAALALAVMLAAAAGCAKTVQTAALTEMTGETQSDANTQESKEGPAVETMARTEPGTEADADARLQEETEETEPEIPEKERVNDLVDRTELNTLVIDVKNDEGRVVCEMDTPLVSQIGAVKRYVQDMPSLVQKCKEKGIYLIARIVAFKDPFLAAAKPEWSLHNADGTVFYDKDGLAWVNPYEPGVWDYLVEVSKGAIELGFDEVQFDYVRFSTDSGMKQVDFGPLAEGKTKEDAVTEFVSYAADALHAMGAAVSADVYGVVIDSEIDQQIVGQDYSQLCSVLDAISPMVYPSHYGPYNYDIPVPDAQPYDTVLAAMQASRKVLAGLDTKLEGTAKSTGAVSGNDVSVSGNAAVS